MQLEFREATDNDISAVIQLSRKWETRMALTENRK